jgi:hypothetical protein
VKNKKKEATIVNTYYLTFTLNGVRTEETVRARSMTEAKRLILDRYRGYRVNFISTGHEYG